MINVFFTMDGEIQRKYMHDDGMGHYTEEWLTIMTSKGRLDALSGGVGMYAHKVNADSTHVWMCSPFLLTIEDPEEQAYYFGSPFQPSPFGLLLPASITEADRFYIDGKFYRMTFIDDPMNFSHHLEIELKRWDSDNV